MPLQGSGSISFSEIAAEYGGTAPHSISEYYRNGSNVDSTKNVAASGNNLSGISGSNAPKWQGGTPANNCRVFQGLSQRTQQQILALPMLIVFYLMAQPL